MFSSEGTEKTVTGKELKCNEYLLEARTGPGSLLCCLCCVLSTARGSVIPVLKREETKAQRDGKLAHHHTGSRVGGSPPTCLASE
jgi:hypothetical protein